MNIVIHYLFLIIFLNIIFYILYVIKIYYILISIPFIFSQNACDNCINNLRSNNNIDCTDICNEQTTHLIDCSDYTRCLYDYNLHKIGELCVCQKPTCNYEHVCPYTRIIEYKDNNLHGYTTYEVSLEVKDLNSNIYAIYGTSTNNVHSTSISNA